MSDARCLAMSLVITRFGQEEDDTLITANYNIITAYNLRTGAVRFVFPEVHQGHLKLHVLSQERGGRGAHCTWLASSDAQGLIALWELSDEPKLLHTLKGHDQLVIDIYRLLHSPNSIVSASYDGSVRVWDLERDEQISNCRLLDGDEAVLSSQEGASRCKNPKTSVHKMVPIPDGRVIFGGGGGYVRVWDAGTGETIKCWQAHFGGIPVVGPILNRILLHPSGKAFVTTGTDGRIRLWDLVTYELLRESRPFEHSTLPDTIAWMGNTLLCGGKDGSPANVCGDFCRVVAWDLARVRLGEGEVEEWQDAIPACNFVWSLWTFGKRVILALQRRGRVCIEVWAS